MEPKVAKEVAEDEISRMLSCLDIETADLDEDDEKKLNTLRSTLVRAVMRGDLTINDKGEPTMVLRYPVGNVTSVYIPRPKGAAMIPAGDKSAKNQVTAIHATLAALSGLPFRVFEEMDLKTDYKVATALVSLFLG